MFVHRLLLCDSEFGATLRSKPPPAAPARAPRPSKNDGGRKENDGRWTGMDFFNARGKRPVRPLGSSLEEELQNNNQMKQQAEEEWRGTGYLKGLMTPADRPACFSQPHSVLRGRALGSTCGTQTTSTPPPPPSEEVKNIFTPLMKVT